MSLQLGRSPRARRAAGIAGIAPGLLMFAGDMLFFGHWGSGREFHAGMLATVQRASDQRLFAGVLLGPVAARMFIVGFWHVFINVEPGAPKSARVILTCLATLMVCGSAVHALWAPYGIALKHCYGQAGACSDLTGILRSHWTAAYDLSAVPGYAGFGLLLILVLMGKTRDPRWTALANPAVRFFFEPLADKGPAPWGAVLSGGFTNLSFVAFFLVSLATTWRGGPELWSEHG